MGLVWEDTLRSSLSCAARTPAWHTDHVVFLEAWPRPASASESTARHPGAARRADTPQGLRVVWA